MLTKWCSRSRLSKGYNEKGNRRVFELCMQMLAQQSVTSSLRSYLFLYLFICFCFSVFFQSTIRCTSSITKFSLSFSFSFCLYFFLFHFLSFFYSKMSILRKNSNDQSEVRICENWASPIFHLYRIDQSATSVGTNRLIGASIKVEDRSKMATLFAMPLFFCLSPIIFFLLLFICFFLDKYLMNVKTKLIKLKYFFMV